MENYFVEFVKNSSELLDLNVDFNILKIVNSFIKENNILYTNYNNSFSLYSNTPLFHANELTNRIFKKNSYVKLLTQLLDKEYIININNSNKIYIFLLLTNKQNVIEKFNYNNKILPPHLQLIKLYRSMYNVDILLNYYNNETKKLNYNSELDSYKSFQELLNLEESLITQFSNYNKILFEKKNTINKNTFKFNILQNLYSKLIEDEKLIDDFALVNYYAIAELKELKEFDFNNNLEIIINNKDSIIKLINVIYEIVKKLNLKDFEIKYYIDNTYLIGDFNFKRYTIYLNIENKKNILCYCYNSFQYELIPVIKKNNFKIPHIYVLIRLNLINLLFIKLYSDNNNYKNYHYYQSLYNLYDIISLYSSFNDYNLIEYKGIVKEEKYDKIIKTIKDSKSQPYIPKQFLLKNKKIRNLKKEDEIKIT